MTALINSYHMILSFAQSFVLQLTYKDIFDLLILWVLVYRVMRMTEKSGIIKILAGILFLAALYGVSYNFKLMSVYFILDNFFSNLLLILVILFQNEIRKVLIEIGAPLFSRNISRVEANRIAEEVTKALKELARRNWGALIIVEKDMNIDSFIENGVMINADVTSELLVSLFQPATPLHDGAVLIREGRIESAGNFLPLSQNSALDKKLGTRHRAAFGITELTDAKVFIVSEERRAIGFVEFGTMHSTQDVADLKQDVVEFLEFGDDE